MPEKPFTVLALGDSIVWGEGLKRRDRFVTRVAERLAEERGRPLRLLSFGHAGAAIRTDRMAHPFAVAEASRDHSYAGEKLFVHGSIGQLHPTAHTQVRIADRVRGYAGYLRPHPSDHPKHRERKEELEADLREMGEPDLIFLSGGINDFNPYRIFVPFTDEVSGRSPSERAVRTVIGRLGLKTTRKAYAKLAERHFGGRVSGLLKDVRKRWPKAPIVVAGYFPTFTHGSFEGRDDAAPALMLYALLRLGKAVVSDMRSFRGFIDFHVRLGRRFLTERSALFDRAHRVHMAQACRDAHGKRAPVVFAAPEFGPDNGAFAKEAWLFGWETVDVEPRDFPHVIDILSTGDPMERERKEATDLYLKHFRKEIPLAKAVERMVRAHRNAVTHPNRKGARAYEAAVLAALDGAGIR